MSVKRCETFGFFSLKTTKMSILSSNGRFFKTDDGRIIMLRGVNLSGSVKQPFSPLLPSHETVGFYEGTNVSFVSRPFPLQEAETHFKRLASWGFNFLRFNVTWEAIEHAGPGIYDEEYIQYVVEILLVAKKHGFRCFIDPHQDVVSSILIS
jgi:aryl-phospho-beta-D-glucosidase BglC (GH1 family)